MTQKQRKKPLRLEIAARDLIGMLEAYVRGETEMKPDRVATALALLKKRLPDLATRPAGPKKKPAPGSEKSRSLEERLKDLI